MRLIGKLNQCCFAATYRATSQPANTDTNSDEIYDDDDANNVADAADDDELLVLEQLHLVQCCVLECREKKQPASERLDGGSSSSRSAQRTHACKHMGLRVEPRQR